ncbi:MAG: hypothetical protein U0457_03245 [Candidatus Sericytochromatia bacterium]
MRNFLKKLVILVLCFCIVSSCAPPITIVDTTTTRQYLPTSEAKNESLYAESNQNCSPSVARDYTFRTLALENIKKPNENYRVKILKKNKNSPIIINNKYKFPKVYPTELNGIKIAPAIIKTIHHEPLTDKERKHKRKEFIKNWLEKLKEQYKKDKKELTKEQKEERLISLKEFKEKLNLFKKGSTERDDFISEQIKIREDLIEDQREERKDLKEQYKKDIIEIRILANNIFGIKGSYSFSTKLFDCGSNPACNPFSDSGIVNTADETQSYDTVDSVNSFEMNDTYVNGQNYSDQDQTQKAEIDPSFDGYELTGENVEYLESKGFIGAGCRIDSAKVYKDGDNVVFKVEPNEDCNLQEMSIEYEVIPNPNSCDNSFKLSFKNPDNKKFAISTNISFNDLGIGSKHKVFLRVVSIDGREERIQIGSDNNTFGTKGYSNFINSSNLSVINEYDNDTLSSLSVIMNPETYQKIEKWSKNYKISIKSSITAVLGYRIILGDYTNREISENDLIKYKICEAQCIPISASSADSGTIIEFDKTKLQNGEYTLLIYDMTNSPIDPNLIHKSFKFTIANPIATNFAIESDIPSRFTEISYKPLYAFGNYSNEYNSSDISNTTISGSIPKLNNTNSISNPKNNCKFIDFAKSSSIQDYQKYILQKALGNETPGNTSNLLQLDTKSCKDKNIMVGSVIDLTNSDPIKNEELYNKNIYVSLSLVVENYYCKTLENNQSTMDIPFYARLGTKHVITKEFIPSLYFGDFCDKEKKVVYVKVKKNVNISKMTEGQVNFTKEAKELDIFPKVTNNEGQFKGFYSPPTNYDGARIVISPCSATTPCSGKKDYSSALAKLSNYDKFNAFKNAYAKYYGLSLNQNLSYYENQNTFFSEGDVISFYDDISFFDNQSAFKLSYFTTPSTYTKETVKLTKAQALKLNEDALTIYDRFGKKEFADIQKMFDALKTELTNTGAFTSSQTLQTKTTNFIQAFRTLDTKLGNTYFSITINGTTRFIPVYTVGKFLLKKAFWVYNVKQVVDTIFDVGIDYQDKRFNISTTYNKVISDSMDRIKDLMGEDCTRNTEKDHFYHYVRYINQSAITPVTKAYSDLDYLFNLNLEIVANLDKLRIFESDFNSAVNIANEVNASASDTINRKCELQCGKDDFEVHTGSYFIDNTKSSRNTLKCRIYNYVNSSKNITPRSTTLVYSNPTKIKGYLEEMNKARIAISNYNQNPSNKTIVIDPTKARTFAFAKYNNTSVYGINKNESIVVNPNATREVDEDMTPDPLSNNFLSLFANPMLDVQDRVYAGKSITTNKITGALSFNSTHAEIRIMEHIAKDRCEILNGNFENQIGTKKFKKYKCTETTLELFTDRELCGFCKATFDTTLTEGENRSIIKGVTPELNVISVNKELEGTDKGIFYLGELVPTLSSGYYLGL